MQTLPTSTSYVAVFASALRGDRCHVDGLTPEPHLLPVARGILATITVPVTEHIANPLELWRETYRDEPFIEISDAMPSLRDVVRRNVVRISVKHAANVRQPTLIIVAAIDNLVKGAAGQAVQNANVMFGLPETAGLPA